MAGAQSALRSLCLGAAVVSLVSLGTAAHAQTPEAVVQDFFTAIDSSDWSHAVSLVHPEALELFHAQQVRNARVEDDNHSNPAIPLEFREHKPVYERVYGVQSAEELDAMPSTVMLAHYLRTQSPNVQYSPVAEAGVRSPGSPTSLRIVGTVPDGDSVTYVIFVWSTNAGRSADSALTSEVPHARVMTLKRGSGKWKVMLDGGVIWGSGGLVLFGKG